MFGDASPSLKRLDPFRCRIVACIRGRTVISCHDGITSIGPVSDRVKRIPPGQFTTRVVRFDLDTKQTRVRLGEFFETTQSLEITAVAPFTTGIRQCRSGKTQLWVSRDRHSGDESSERVLVESVQRSWVLDHANTESTRTGSRQRSEDGRAGELRGRWDAEDVVCFPGGHWEGPRVTWGRAT
jgi:hypothetical protein